MKYIRTKDGIYKVILVSPLNFVRIDKRDETYPDVFEKEIINQADTIEELCDGYVIEHPINAFKFFYDKEEMQLYLFNTCMRMFDMCELKIYGCIKTDKGLIYVAKMNVKGELELL